MFNFSTAGVDHDFSVSPSETRMFEIGELFLAYIPKRNRCYVCLVSEGAVSSLCSGFMNLYNRVRRCVATELLSNSENTEIVDAFCVLCDDKEITDDSAYTIAVDALFVIEYMLLHNIYDSPEELEQLGLLWDTLTVRYAEVKRYVQS